MFDSLLIANRGEIAVRIARTARRLGIRTIAVYSEADRHARHVAAADEAVLIGRASARDSYLNIERIVAAAKRTGARAVHPGYGFLSERAEFAEACAAAGLVFVGPPPTAIRAMGSKSAAKEILSTAGVPLVPGYHGEDQDDAILERAAAEIGYPVLVKASAGGGGRGMRVVEDEAGLPAAIAAARREAMAAFGDDRLLIEKYLDRPRHVEVQVFADSHGSAVHLFERDCSIQRRHQKVVEEAPAPGLASETRQRMGDAAVAAAQAIGYEGAGTVEFLLDRSGAFYFIEMNTRLQVEHPVTEMITGFDLVEWQLRVAAGEPLPRRQHEIAIDGHAIEVRLYAEDPARGFLPQTGHLRHLRMPAEGPHVRIDTGVGEGDTISVHYDPMIFKLIVWDRDRRAAIRRLERALGEVQIVGLATNLPFLAAIASHPAFGEADLGTDFIERFREDLFPTPKPLTDEFLALATLHVLESRAAKAARAAAASNDPHSPWSQVGGWRLNGSEEEILRFRDGEGLLEVGVLREGIGYRLRLPGGSIEAAAELDADGTLVADVDGLRSTATVVPEGEGVLLITRSGVRHVALHDSAAAALDQDSHSGLLTAPMPGKIVRVLVSEGDSVERGAPLIVLEAMKMEHTIAAPAAGIVEKVPYVVGDMVDEGTELIVLAAGS